MEREPYICLNGRFYKESEPVLTHQNRGFRYGDALFETMFVSRSSVPFLDDHYERLLKSMKVLQMKVPVRLTKDHIRDMIRKLVNKNRIFKGGRVRLTVFREKGGTYTPVSNDTSYLIELSRLENPYFSLNERGLNIDIYPDIHKPVNPLSSLKSANALLFVLAGEYKKVQNLDECIILNEKHYVAETISSNIYLVKGHNIYTPSLKQGCINGVMRKQVLGLADSLEYKIYENRIIRPRDLTMADEIFLSNAVKGIQWVVAFKEKRYFNRTAKQILDKLNQEIDKRRE